MTLQKLLGFDKQKMSVRVEVIGGLTTFLTMCYILAVNPALSFPRPEWTRPRFSPEQPLQPAWPPCSIFFAPLFLLIPAAATSGALVMVGVLMVDSVKKINLEDVSESFPAFITMITMVLCYSIADGICLGFLSYVIIKLCAGKWKNLNVTLVVLALLFIINYALG